VPFTSRVTRTTRINVNATIEYGQTSVYWKPYTGTSTHVYVNAALLAVDLSMNVKNNSKAYKNIITDSLHLQRIRSFDTTSFCNC